MNWLYNAFVTGRFLRDMFPRIMETHDRLELEIRITKAELGDERTAELLERLKSEAVQQTSLNSDYIINGLMKARVKTLPGRKG